MNTFHIRRLDQSIIVKDVTDQGLELLFKEVFPCFDFKLGESESPVETITIHSVDDGWVIEEQMTLNKQFVKTAGDLAYYLSDRIIYNLIKNMSDGHCVHAACVVKDKHAIVMPAMSGSGKSSLLAWFLSQGFDYVTDELVIFTGDNKLQAIPRPVQIKSAGITVVDELIESSALERLSIHGEIATSFSPSAFGASFSMLSEFELALLLFPKYSKDCQYNFQESSSAQAAVNLMASHVNARSLEAHGFKFMSDLARRSDAYSLQYGGYRYLNSRFLDEVRAFI